MKIKERVIQNFEQSLEDLKTLVRIPSVSFPDFPTEELERSAEAVAKLLKARGFENVQILHIGKTHPYVYGERLRAPGKPTLLLYAHHDVQPAGRREIWKSDPFEPVVRPGPGGDRLWGRGTADDKAGIIVHTAAVSAWLDEVGELPVNVKIVIEGEEEVGSDHLPEFLEKHKKLVSADVLVLTDTANHDCGVPALTVSLRGLVAVSVEVRSTSKAIHSGLWGGPIPDPVMGLSKALASLSDDQGRLAVRSLQAQVKAPTADERKALNAIPMDPKEFREQSGLKPQVKLFDHASLVEQLWRMPSVTVTAVEASSRKNASNIINDAAWARVTVRTCAGMDPEFTLAELKRHIAAHVPWGLEVKFDQETASGAWSTETTGPAFDAARKSMEIGYGRAPLMIGAGASIPFVKPFAEALGGAPALLIGVEDPYTNAHGENESLLISDLQKACVSQALLFSELAERFRR